MKDATRKRGRNASNREKSKRAREIERELCGECTVIHQRQRRASSLACSRGNFANPRDTKRNVVTSGLLSCGGGSRFTLGVSAGTENHDCRVARERRRDEQDEVGREGDRMCVYLRERERERERERGDGWKKREREIEGDSNEGRENG